ncbi:MAG: transporter substrate-binding domain-containing protein [Rhodospirillaceae bacterium]|jgi:polar amino acid transport system substrate-binding protein|nr:transporter substrate-binding domain-containing protein [Rhodospirillaceae bacterium]MBT4589322.1 transporter substrate-binding domain-containing protein [Rhodospirillaceae bacterium]MBT5939751.1 transporter substrate-binding domain-containing protein [Rhodospirillaceae bacterium]MBT7266748.1 transporter substrate-binding domain-containing protein [Rhodospirillaceae bacterium]
MPKSVSVTRFIIIFLSFYLTVNLGSSAYAQKAVVFSKPGPLDFHAQISENILKEAYARIGIVITTKEFSGERALRESNSGRLDGEVNRIRGIDKNYKNLRIVPVAINALKGTVFTKLPELKIRKWQDLKSLTIGLRLGAKFAEYNTQGMRVISAATNKMVFRMLDRDRVDVVISTALEGTITKMKLELKGISMVEPPLVTLDLFHFLHKDHEDLLPRITAALKAMEREARIKKIRDTAFKRYTN